jgi:PAS domain S-box-containing protein
MGQYQLSIVLTLVSFVVNLVLGVISLTVDPRNRLNRSFGILAYTLAWWGLMKLAIFFSATEEWASLFYRLSGLGWTFLPFTYSLVVFALIRRHSGRHRVMPWVLGGASLVLYAVLWSGDLMLAGMKMEKWGYTDVPGPVMAMGFQPFLIVSLVYLLVELAVYSARAETRDDRMKGILVLVGMLVPFVGGALTNMVLPTMGIYVFELAVPLTTVNAAFIAYAAYRYRLLSMHVDYVSRTIMDTVGEALLAVNTTGRVGLANDAAAELLGHERRSISGMHLNDLMHGRSFDEEFRKAAAGDGRTRFDEELARADGTTVAVDLRVSELRNDRGNLVGYVLSARRRSSSGR